MKLCRYRFNNMRSSPFSFALSLFSCDYHAHLILNILHTTLDSITNFGVPSTILNSLPFSYLWFLCSCLSSSLLGSVCKLSTMLLIFLSCNWIFVNQSYSSILISYTFMPATSVTLGPSTGFLLNASACLTCEFGRCSVFIFTKFVLPTSDELRQNKFYVHL